MKEKDRTQKREHLRADVAYIVNYKCNNPYTANNITQTKNISQGGLLLTAQREFGKGTRIEMGITYPAIFPKKIDVTGEVVGVREIVKKSIYEISIKFLNLSEKNRSLLKIKAEALEWDGVDKRKHERIVVNLSVSYRAKNSGEPYGITQTNDINEAGMLIATNKKFKNATRLELAIRFFVPIKKVLVIGEVLESVELVKDSIYKTRVKFLNMDKGVFKEINNFINKNKGG